MKKSLLLVLLAGALGFACAYGLFRPVLKQQPDAVAQTPAAALSEKTGFEPAPSAAHGQAVVPVVATAVAEAAKDVSPEEILARLKMMKVTAEQPRSARVLGHEFEKLIECGPAALPAISDFLASGADVDYDLATFAKSARGGKFPLEFSVPPTLRLGLFEALKDIGSADAEKTLADALTVTGRGLEVAYLARVLEQLSPGTYRAIAVQAAHNLLAHPSANVTDKDDRNYLLATLTFLNDPSFADQAQAQLVQADGKVDAAALKYLQQTQPKKALALALATYQDPRVTDANTKERLAQVALDTAGTDPAADHFFYAAMGDPNLPAANRDNLAQDFADHGTNPKNPSAQDIQVMQKRLAMLQQLQNEITDPKVLAGIMEGQKDLNKFIAAYAAAHLAQ